MTYAKRYPYAANSFVAWDIASGKTAFGIVIQDCGSKYAFGTAKYDYVRIRRFYPSTGEWTKTIVRVRRECLHGVVEGELPTKFKRALEELRRKDVK